MLAIDPLEFLFAVNCKHECALELTLVSIKRAYLLPHDPVALVVEVSYKDSRLLICLGYLHKERLL